MKKAIEISLALLLVLTYPALMVSSQSGKSSATNPSASTDLKLTELEQTKYLLNQEKQRSNAQEAELMRVAYEKNQNQQQSLRQEAQQIHDSICRAHGLDTTKCSLSLDGAQILKPPAAPPPPPNTAPASKSK